MTEDDDGGFVQEDNDVGSEDAEDEVEAAISRAQATKGGALAATSPPSPLDLATPAPLSDAHAEGHSSEPDFDQQLGKPPQINLASLPANGDDALGALMGSPRQHPADSVEALARLELMEEDAAAARASEAVAALTPRIGSTSSAAADATAMPDAAADVEDNEDIMEDNGGDDGFAIPVGAESSQSSALGRPPSSSSSGGRPASARPTSARPGGRPLSSRISSANQRVSAGADSLGAIVEDADAAV